MNVPFYYLHYITEAGTTHKSAVYRGRFDPGPLPWTEARTLFERMARATGGENGVRYTLVRADG